MASRLDLLASNGRGAIPSFSNGSETAVQAHRLGMPAGPAGSSVESPHHEQLLAAITALSGLVQEGISRAPTHTHDELQASLKGLMDHMEMLPGRIAAALADALGRQHRLIMQEIRSALEEFETRLQGSSDTSFLSDTRVEQPGQ